MKTSQTCPLHSSVFVVCDCTCTCNSRTSIHGPECRTYTGRTVSPEATIRRAIRTGVQR